jgi:predicted SprT family Zn-dependent metalloprotease
MSAPTTLSEAKRLLEEKMMDILGILETKTGKGMPIPTLQLRGGYATRCGGCIIVINSDMLNEKWWEKTLHETLPHEICHHIAPLIYCQWKHGYDKHEGWGHKKAWQECMTIIGLKPDRCFDIDDEDRNELSLRIVKRKYAYKCNCKTHLLTAIKHNRFQRSGYNRLHCRLCNGNLTYLGEKINS